MRTLGYHLTNYPMRARVRVRSAYDQSCLCVYVSYVHTYVCQFVTGIAPSGNGYMHGLLFNPDHSIKCPPNNLIQALVSFLIRLEHVIRFLYVALCKSLRTYTYVRSNSPSFYSSSATCFIDVCDRYGNSHCVP